MTYNKDNPAVNRDKVTIPLRQRIDVVAEMSGRLLRESRAERESAIQLARECDPVFEPFARMVVRFGVLMWGRDRHIYLNEAKAIAAHLDQTAAPPMACLAVTNAIKSIYAADFRSNVMDATRLHPGNGWLYYG